MSAPPPPPPTRATPFVPLPLRAVAHPADALFREHQVLERRLPSYYTVHLTPEERSFIPSDVPDVLDLSNITHALSLVGPNARFSRQIILELQQSVKQVANAVATFKKHGDVLIALKDQVRRKTAEVEVELVESEMTALRAALAVVKTETDSLKQRLYSLREESKNSPPMSNGGIEPRVYPVESAEWIIRPIFYFKEEELDENKHTVEEFAQWAQYAVNDPSSQHLVRPLLQHLDALQYGRVNKDLVRARIGDYMKHFKASLPETAWLVDTSKRRGTGVPKEVRVRRQNNLQLVL